jgi:hypothetical protein
MSFSPLLKTIFSSRNPRRFPSVQRRAAVKGAARPRSSQTLDGEHRWRTLSLKGAGEVEKKWGRRKTASVRNTKQQNWSGAGGENLRGGLL